MAAARAELLESLPNCDNIQLTLMSNGIVQAVLHRPTKMNALNSEMYACLAAVMALPATAENIVAIVLTGSGAAFTAGADVSSPTDDAAPLHEAPVADFMHAMVRGTPAHDISSSCDYYHSSAQIDCVVPIFVAVNGAAIGIGVTMLPHADLVVADPQAYFMLPFLRNAIVPEFACTRTLPSCIGTALTNDMLYTGRKLCAQEALHAGLVSRISPPGAAASVALGVAAAMAAQPLAAKSVRIFRSMMRKQQREQLHAVVTWELQLLDERLQNGDAAQAVVAWWASRLDGGSSDTSKL
jgi:enoyl-CoA hydratase/carnithine racemase